MTAYEMCINNIALQIQKLKPSEINPDIPNAFDYSTGISAGFCKDPKEVVCDIVVAVGKLGKKTDE
ncbi:hypothetical protein [Klebsiella phage UPM 2146]|uniref:Uncharacterized protein n=1 Tax=Klebsiella phage UPM 2146 TaxID=2847816 RepID=A0A5Q2F2H7_9CAUD|nr:hypothetical protein HYQ02_gp017 [Klebsiella phage UPM 2146]QGF20535.1 hypothetical protein [Klebsiella phage UPM 2146]